MIKSIKSTLISSPAIAGLLISKILSVCEPVKNVFILLLFVSILIQIQDQNRWTPEKANKWYATQPLLVGANFVPSTAINQLEMFQAETFPTDTMKRLKTVC